MNQVLIFPLGLPHRRFQETFALIYGAQLIASLFNAMIFATFETACTSYQMYDYLVFKFGRKDLFDAITISTVGKYLGLHLTAFVAQLFYASRIWVVTGRLRKRRFLTYPIILLSLIQVAAGLAQVIIMAHAKTLLNLRPKAHDILKTMVVQAVSAAACDIAITGSFSLIFRTNHSGLNSRSHSLMNKFIVYVINRAAATSFGALLTLFTFKVLSGTYFYMIPLLINTHYFQQEEPYEK
ncbi:hypothetical protein BDQ17DRAFT_1334956 [Cyathus striatus]|nr:hypothetical protein BDQ17DRAFT_1334956 [Cyathus striatus]